MYPSKYTEYSRPKIKTQRRMARRRYPRWHDGNTRTQTTVRVFRSCLIFDILARGSCFQFSEIGAPIIYQIPVLLYQVSPCAGKYSALVHHLVARPSYRVCRARHVLRRSWALPDSCKMFCMPVIVIIMIPPGLLQQQAIPDTGHTPQPR